MLEGIGDRALQSCTPLPEPKIRGQGAPGQPRVGAWGRALIAAPRTDRGGGNASPLLVLVARFRFLHRSGRFILLLLLFGGGILEPEKDSAPPPRISLWPLALLGTLLLASLSSKRSCLKERVDTHNTSDNKGANIPKEVTLNHPKSVKTTDSGDESSNSHKWTKISAIAQACAVPIAILLLAVNTCQMDVVRRNSRPRLTITGFSPQPTTSGTQQPLDRGRLHINISIPNYGPMPARNVRLYTFDSVTSWNGVVKLHYGGQHWDAPQVIFTTPITGPPSLGLSSNRILSVDEIKGLISHDLVATFSILVKYDDDWGITHRAEYCGEFTFQPSPWSQTCPWPVHND